MVHVISLGLEVYSTPSNVLVEEYPGTTHPGMTKYSLETLLDSNKLSEAARSSYSDAKSLYFFVAASISMGSAVISALVY